MLLTSRYPNHLPPLAFIDCTRCGVAKGAHHQAGCAQIVPTIHELVMGVPAGWDGYPRRLPVYVRALLLAVEDVRVWQAGNGNSLVINTTGHATHDATWDIHAAERMGLVDLAEGEMFGARIWYLTERGEKSLRRFRWLPWRTR